MDGNPVHVKDNHQDGSDHDREQDRVLIQGDSLPRGSSCDKSKEQPVEEEDKPRLAQDNHVTVHDGNKRSQDRDKHAAALPWGAGGPGRYPTLAATTRYPKNLTITK